MAKKHFVDMSNATALMEAIKLRFDAVDGAYVFHGSVAFNGLPATLQASMVGWTYNLTEEFTTDSRFVEGAGNVYPAGTNVAIADVGTASTPDLKFDVLAGFIDVAAIYTEIGNVAAMIADKFLETETYEVGDIVTHNNFLYRFTTAQDVAGAWDSSKVEDVTVEEIINEVAAAATAGIAGANARIDKTQTDIAPAFDATSGTYAVGDLVIYNDELYKFTTAHDTPGAWVASEVTKINLDTVVKTLQAADAALGGRIDLVRNDLAPEFDPVAGVYAVGDIVTYQDVLYKFTTAHSVAGPWVAAEVDDVTIIDLIEAADAESLTSTEVQDLIDILNGTVTP